MKLLREENGYSVKEIKLNRGSGIETLIVKETSDCTDGGLKRGDEIRFSHNGEVYREYTVDELYICGITLELYVELVDINTKNRIDIKHREMINNKVNSLKYHFINRYKIV